MGTAVVASRHARPAEPAVAEQTGRAHPAAHVVSAEPAVTAVAAVVCGPPIGVWSGQCARHAVPAVAVQAVHARPAVAAAAQPAVSACCPAELAVEQSAVRRRTQPAASSPYSAAAVQCPLGARAAAPHAAGPRMTPEALLCTMLRAGCGPWVGLDCLVQKGGVRLHRPGLEGGAGLLGSTHHPVCPAAAVCWHLHIDGDQHYPVAEVHIVQGQSSPGLQGTAVCLRLKTVAGHCYRAAADPLGYHPIHHHHYRRRRHPCLPAAAAQYKTFGVHAAAVAAGLAAAGGIVAAAVDGTAAAAAAAVAAAEGGAAAALGAALVGDAEARPEVARLMVVVVVVVLQKLCPEGTKEWGSGEWEGEGCLCQEAPHPLCVWIVVEVGEWRSAAYSAVHPAPADMCAVPAVECRPGELVGMAVEPADDRPAEVQRVEPAVDELVPVRYVDPAAVAAVAAGLNPVTAVGSQAHGCLGVHVFLAPGAHHADAAVAAPVPGPLPHEGRCCRGQVEPAAYLAAAGCATGP